MPEQEQARPAAPRRGRPPTLSAEERCANAREACRRWRQNNPEKVVRARQARVKALRAANPPAPRRPTLSVEEKRRRANEYVRRGQQANPEKYRAQARRAVAKRRAKNPSPMRELERVARLTVEWLKADPAVPRWSYEMLADALKALRFYRWHGPHW